jgi:hypothetical protein
MLISEQRPVMTDRSAYNRDKILLRLVTRNQQAARNQRIEITQLSAIRTPMAMVSKAQ